MTFHTPRLRAMFAPALAGLLVVGVACGDDDGGSGGPTGPEADERYLQQLCTGFDQFTESFLEAVTNLDAESSDEQVQEALDEPIDNLVRMMEDAEPPADIREYHEDSLEQLKKMQEEIRDGNLDALSDQDAEVVPEPPADVRERLMAAAQNIEECEGLNLFE